ncbi:hypothetical protein, partial [Serratia ureilytica]|uniref:hypothetical protein n=1 Tax=Serratia ureilytica TaxID=300181 RepID=UPI00254C8D72
PPVRQAVQARYRAYRRSGASALTAFFTTLLVALGWMLLRLESPAWRTGGTSSRLNTRLMAQRPV